MTNLVLGLQELPSTQSRTFVQLGQKSGQSERKREAASLGRRKLQSGCHLPIQVGLDPRFDSMVESLTNVSLGATLSPILVANASAGFVTRQHTVTTQQISSTDAVFPSRRVWTQIA